MRTLVFEARVYGHAALTLLQVLRRGLWGSH